MLFEFHIVVCFNKDATEHLQEEAGVLHGVALMVILEEAIDVGQLLHVFYSPDGMDMAIFQTDADGGVVRVES